MDVDRATAAALDGVRVWVDGDLAGPDARVRALDHGLTVGDGVFETCKVIDGQPFALSRHHARMDRSLAALGLPPVDRGRIQEGIDAVLGQGGMPFGRLRYTLTAGVGPLGSDRLEGAATHLVTAVAQEVPGPTSSIAVVPWTRNERGALTGVKSTSYAENVVALAAAKELGHGEAVLANTAGLLCEGTGTNVFVVLDGVVHTPALSCGPLAGVTRGLALEWLREEGMEVWESQLPLAVLAEAQEVWLTSSLRDISAVTTIGVAPGVRLASGEELPAVPLTDRDLGAGPGPVARAASEIFARRAAATPDP